MINMVKGTENPQLVCIGNGHMGKTFPVSFIGDGGADGGDTPTRVAVVVVVVSDVVVGCTWGDHGSPW